MLEKVQAFKATDGRLFDDEKSKRISKSNKLRKRHRLYR